MATLDKAESITYQWPQQGEWTYNDYARLPDDGWRYEIIGGELHMSPAPNAEHQSIVAALVHLLRSFVRQNDLGRVLVAPIDVMLPDLASPVQPDVLVIPKANVDIIRQRVEGVPDLVIEVLSPATARHDRTTKYRLYAEAGVTEVGIIDPDAQTADIYTRRGNGFVPLGHYERGGVIQSELLPALRLPLDELLADA
jgi:Uma2 family endonuclease